MIFVPVAGSKTKKIKVRLDKKGQEEHLVVVFAGRGKDVIELDLASIHEAPATQGRVTVRGILRDSAQARIRGLIKIKKGAPQSRDFLEERTLLLGKNSRVEAVPELEIEEEDVTASHAASSGVVSEEDLFYLRSRGISRKRALDLIVEGFLAQAVFGLEFEGREGKQVVSKLEKVKSYALDQSRQNL